MKNMADFFVSSCTIYIYTLLTYGANSYGVETLLNKYKTSKKTKFIVPKMYRANRWFILPLIGQFLQYFSGWKIEGTLPDINKIVIVCAPHTSNWDFIIGMMMVLFFSSPSSLVFSFLQQKCIN